MFRPSSHSTLLALGMILSPTLTGCSQLGSAVQIAVAPSIVGRWQLTSNSGDVIEFFPDGTVRDAAPLKTTNGKYLLLDGKRLKLETDGLLWGTNVTMWSYTLDADHLSMTTEGGTGITMSYTRVK